MDKKSLRLLHLKQIRGVTRPIIWKLLKSDPQLQNIYDYNLKDLRDILRVDPQRAEALYQGLHQTSLQKEILQDLQQYQAITIFDKNYPPQLRFIPDPPLSLYLKGNIDILSHQPNISIVGTRYPSDAAKTIMQTLLKPLINEKWLLVSGMALGIDGYVHELAMKYDSPTIAVLGSGFRHVYPKQHVEMYQNLSRHNLVISEYPPYKTPQKYHFPERNRIISGLTFGTLVIEAKEKSGSLITVDQALEQGREVFAVPGSILCPTSRGCNQLIKDGAKSVLTGQEIIEEWHDQKVKWIEILNHSPQS